MQFQKQFRPRAVLLHLVAFALLLLPACERQNDRVSGTIEVDEVRVAPRFGGRVSKIHVQEGDTLTAGTVIAELEAPELRARRELAIAQMDTAERDVEAFAAQLKFMRADAQRQQELLKSSAVSSNEAERAMSVANAQEKTLAAAQSRVAQTKAQLEEIAAQLEEMKVVAPSDSVLEILSVRVGDVLPPNREVATLLLPDRLWVRVYIPQPWLGHIRLQEEVRVRVDSFPDEEFRGVIEQIARQAEFTPRNVQTVEDRIRQVFGVKIRLENRDDKLRAGMSADITFPNVPKD
ncbi:MAG: efflux RND transporter periplasmic adaptor subunit [Chthoniobacterales bacterium]|nr:efflux RND transporter periplasmic adaptor subunit [Chthoniobacterales bacterium]